MRRMGVLAATLDLGTGSVKSEPKLLPLHPLLQDGVTQLAFARRQG